MFPLSKYVGLEDCLSSLDKTDVVAEPSCAPEVWRSVRVLAH